MRVNPGKSLSKISLKPRPRILSSNGNVVNGKEIQRKIGSGRTKVVIYFSPSINFLPEVVYLNNFLQTRKREQITRARLV